MLRALLILLCVSPALAAEVTLRESVVVSGDFIRVSDVATVTGESSDLVSATVVSPAPTTSHVLTADDVRQRLIAAGLWSADSSVDGSARCLVVSRREPTPLPQSAETVSPYDARRASEKLASLVEERLADAFPGRSFQVSVELDEADIESVLADKQGHLSGGSADLTQLQNLVLHSSSPVRFTAKLTETPAILVTSASLPRGTVLRASHLKRAPVGEPGLSDASVLLGQELQRPMRAGSPVTQRDVKPVILVRNGAIVTVSVDAPGIRVSRQMKSRDSGGMGDSIQCVSLDGKKIVAATVTGPNTASVGPTLTPPTDIRDETGTVMIRTTDREPIQTISGASR